MSPVFPTGSFAYSSGLEQAIADGRVQSAAQVEDWLRAIVESGSVWNDAVLFAACWCTDPGEVNDIALALSGSAERYLETTQLGGRFSIAAAVWTGELPAQQVIAYPVAAGRACCRQEIPKREATIAFLQGICAALVSVAVRLVPLGQTPGLMVMRNLAGVIVETADRACAASLEDLGSVCIAAEIAAMKHETLQPRIFRT
jgi:urease accessory protein